jgi:peroxiredoxin
MANFNSMNRLTQSFLKLCIPLIAGLLLFTSTAFSAGHRITGTIKNYNGNVAYLSMLYGGHQYIVDTATVVAGSFAFESQYELQSGVYVVILPPATSFLLLVDQNIRQFHFVADASDVQGTMVFDGSKDNDAYYDYLRFFETKRSFIDSTKSAYEAKVNENDRVELLARMQNLKKEVIDYQEQLVAAQPGSLTAAMIKCELPVEVPGFTGSPEEIQLKKYQFQKAHFFDNVDLADERLIRAPKNVLVDRVDYYMDHLTVQLPDSIIKSVDHVLAMSKPSDEAYRFFLTHIFNKYREAKSIGMDAVFVHVAEEYIAKGKAPWIEADERNAVLAAVSLISPTLIGKKAPDFEVQLRDETPYRLYDVASPYTVLFFWSPNCAHCQQSMPLLNDFQAKYEDKGVQVFAVCTKVNEQEKNCWDYIDQKEFKGWINASDKMGGSSRIHSQYNIKTTPKIYVLDKDKVIMAKDLGIEHLEEVMNRLMTSK